jgi:hypothetical protein
MNVMDHEFHMDQLFNNLLTQNAYPPNMFRQGGQPGLPQAPRLPTATYLVPAPPDPPFPPSIIISKEKILSYVAASTVTLFIVFCFLLWRVMWLPLVVAIGAVQWYMWSKWTSENSTFYDRQNLARQGLLLPPPSAAQHYMIELPPTMQ